MKSNLLKTLLLAAPILLAGCNTTSTYSHPSNLEKMYYKGCATTPPEDPACGHH